MPGISYTPIKADLSDTGFVAPELNPWENFDPARLQRPERSELIAKVDRIYWFLVGSFALGGVMGLAKAIIPDVYGCKLLPITACAATALFIFSECKKHFGSSRV